MSLADTIAEIRASRPGNVDAWKAAIEAGVRLAARVKQGDIPYHAEPRVPGNQWVSLNECMPDEAKTGDGKYSLEAWCDTEGVLDIEVPRHLSAELAAWVEESSLRCGRSIGADSDRATLAVNLYRAPPAPVVASEPQGEAQTITPDVADSSAFATGV